MPGGRKREGKKKNDKENENKTMGAAFAATA